MQSRHNLTRLPANSGPALLRLAELKLLLPAMAMGVAGLAGSLAGAALAVSTPGAAAVATAEASPDPGGLPSGDSRLTDAATGSDSVDGETKEADVLVPAGVREGAVAGVLGPGVCACLLPPAGGCLPEEPFLLEEPPWPPCRCASRLRCAKCVC